MDTEKKLKKLESLLQMIDESLTREEFVKSFEAVVEFVKQIRTENERRILKIAQSTDQALEKLEESFQKLGQKYDSKFEDFTNDAKQELTLDIETLKNEVHAETENRISKIKIPDQAEIETNLAKKIPTSKDLWREVSSENLRDKLELLKGEDRLDKAAIRGLEEELKTIAKNVGAKRSVSIGGFRKPQYSKFSFTGDGVTTSFKLVAEPAGDGLAIWAYYNSAWLQPDIHFTVAGMNFNTTFIPADGTTIEGFFMRIL